MPNIGQSSADSARSGSIPERELNHLSTDEESMYEDSYEKRDRERRERRRKFICQMTSSLDQTKASLRDLAETIERCVAPRGADSPNAGEPG